VRHEGYGELRTSCLLVLVVCSCAMAGSNVCDDVHTNVAEDMLRGKHLNVLDYEWPGFAEKDVAAPKGWKGLDIDLLDEIGERLGFTYEVAEMATIGDESWAQMLDRSVEQTDLILSYWGRTTARINTMSMLMGHVDYSSVLVAKKTGATEESFTEKIFQFARPFSLPVWGVLIVLIVLSGLMDYMLERGFEAPRSKTSAVYQIMLGFIVMIVVASYTANLTTFLTMSSLPAPGISSIEELVVNTEPACVRTGDPVQTAYESNLPRKLIYNKMPYADLDDSMRDGTCQAAITPRTNFDTWLTDGRNCDLTLVGGTLVFSSAGWITSANTSQCIQRPIEMMLHKLAEEGFIKLLMFKWVQPAQCASDALTEAASTSRRRRLGHEDFHMEGVQGAGHGVHGTADHRRRRLEHPNKEHPMEHKRRRLSEGSSSSSGVSSRMEIGDFYGILIMWAAATGIVISMRVMDSILSWPSVKAWLERRHAARASLAKSIKRLAAGKVDLLEDQKMNLAASKMQASVRGLGARRKKAQGLFLLDKWFGADVSEAKGHNSQNTAVQAVVRDVHWIKTYLMLAHEKGEKERKGQKGSPPAKSQAKSPARANQGESPTRLDLGLLVGRGLGGVAEDESPLLGAMSGAGLDESSTLSSTLSSTCTKSAADAPGYSLPGSWSLRA